MHKIHFNKSLVVLPLLLWLVACGGGGEGGSVLPVVNESAGVLNGQVADGYLSGARVYLDRNGNRELDPGEPSTVSGAQGRYSLDVNPGEGDLYPIVAEIIAGQTIDEDLNQPVPKSYCLESPAGQWKFVSPLTTLIKQEQDKDPSLSLQGAESRIRSQLGLNSGISLFEDYLQSPGNAGMEKAHRAAMVISRLMGSLQATIEENVGVAGATGQDMAIGLMISDQILDNRSIIAQGLLPASSNLSVEEITQTVLGGIEPSNLNAVLLARYVASLNTPSPVWDMLPPKVISQNPVVNGSAPVDIILSLTFDEKLDASSVTDTSLQLIGPNGAENGILSYDASTQKLEFVSDRLLMAFTQYQVQLSDVADSYGNRLLQPQAWTFTTIFDQVPPALPDF